VGGAPYVLTYLKVKSVLGPEGPKIEDKREGPLGWKKGLMGRRYYTCHLNIGNVHKTGQVMAGESILFKPANSELIYLPFELN
jgi:hypothetical protein